MKVGAQVFSENKADEIKKLAWNIRLNVRIKYCIFVVLKCFMFVSYIFQIYNLNHHSGSSSNIDNNNSDKNDISTVVEKLCIVGRQWLCGILH